MGVERERHGAPEQVVERNRRETNRRETNRRETVGEPIFWASVEATLARGCKRAEVLEIRCLSLQYNVCYNA